MTRASRPVRSQKRKRLESRIGSLTTSVALPRVLHQQTMMAALQLNWTLAEIIRAALEEWLARHQAELTGDRR